MKRTHPITDVIIESLSDNTFSFDCTSILLTQQTDKEPIIQYSGPGSISKGDSEDFTIKLYSNVPAHLRTQPIRFSVDIAESYIPGQIIHSSEYFKMEAVAYNGEIWTAENIWLSGNVNYNTHGMILSGLTGCITLAAKCNRTHYIFDMTCLHQDFRFPCNSFTEDSSGRTRNKSEFEIDTTKCILTTLKNTLNIQLISETPFPNHFDRAFLNALQISTGKQLKLIHKRAATPTESVVTLNAELNTSPFSSLYCTLPNCNRPWGLSTSSEFIAKLLPKLINEETPHFLQYFMDMFTAYRSGIEASALGFSVAVEGMASHYFKKLGKSDPIFVEKCLAAIPIINNAESDGLIETNVRDKLLASLKGAAASSPKNTLYKLFDKKVTDQWVKIRHPAAHGSLLDKNLTPQELVNCTHTCLYMFYAMLSAHIDYKGQIINYSIPEHATVDNEVFKNIKAIESRV